MVRRIVFVINRKKTKQLPPEFRPSNFTNISFMTGRINLLKYFKKKKNVTSIKKKKGPF